MDYFQPKSIARQPNRIINQAIQKYGIDSFIIVIFEYTDKIDLHHSELVWLNSVQPEYNVLKFVGSSLGFKLSQENKDKISNATP